MSRVQLNIYQDEDNERDCKAVATSGDPQNRSACIDMHERDAFFSEINTDNPEDSEEIQLTQDESENWWDGDTVKVWMTLERWEWWLDGYELVA